jgi:hypothetical protein
MRVYKKKLGAISPGSAPVQWGIDMRDHQKAMATVFGVATAVFLTIPAFAQTQTGLPSPSLFQSSPVLSPNLAQTQAPDQPAPAAVPPPPQDDQQATPAGRNAQTAMPEKAKVKAKATAQAKKPGKLAKAKPAPQMAPPAAEATPPAEAMPTGKIKRTAKLGSGMKMTAARAPRDIVAAIYQVSAGKDGSYSGPSAFDDNELRHHYFSKGLIADLAALQAKSGGAPILDFDPITNSEGPDVQDLDIAIESEQPDHVIIAAKFQSADAASVLHYDFIKEGKSWKLDDIRGEIVGQSGQWSLREIIKNSLQRS